MFKSLIAVAPPAIAVLAEIIIVPTTSSPNAVPNCYPKMTPDSRYVVRGEAIEDLKTGLIWQRCPLGRQWKEGAGCVGDVKLFTWDEAVRQENDGWRLPTNVELRTLVAENCGCPSINESIFPQTSVHYYGLDLEQHFWTSTEYGSTYAWSVVFCNGGYSFLQNRTDAIQVRLVHDPHTR